MEESDVLQLCSVAWFVSIRGYCAFYHGIAEAIVSKAGRPFFHPITFKGIRKIVRRTTCFLVRFSVVIQQFGRRDTNGSAFGTFYFQADDAGCILPEVCYVFTSLRNAGCCDSEGIHDFQWVGHLCAHFATGAFHYQRRAPGCIVEAYAGPSGLFEV